MAYLMTLEYVVPSGEPVQALFERARKLAGWEGPYPELTEPRNIFRAMYALLGGEESDYPQQYHCLTDELDADVAKEIPDEKDA